MMHTHTDTREETKGDPQDKATKHLFIVELKKSLDFQINSFYTQMTLLELNQRMLDMMTHAMVWFKVFLGVPNEKSDIWINPDTIRTITFAKGIGKDHTHR